MERMQAGKLRGMIDLLSYTAMDLHAARPVAGCRSSSQSLGIGVSSSSVNVKSDSRQSRGTHVPGSSLSDGLREARPSTLRLPNRTATLTFGIGH